VKRLLFVIFRSNKIRYTLDKAISSVGRSNNAGSKGADLQLPKANGVRGRSPNTAAILQLFLQKIRIFRQIFVLNFCLKRVIK